MADVQHSSLTDPKLHEPKGISTADAKDLYQADGAGSGDWKTPYMFGVYDYNDAATTSTPITLSSGSKVKMTNDGAGSSTNTAYKVPGQGDIWSVASNHFDFTSAGLALGDTVDIRFDIDVIVNAANDVIELILTPGFGATPYDLLVGRMQYKASGTYQWTVFYSLYMGDSNTLDNPMEVYLKADSAGDTAVVNGWYVRPMYRNGLWV